MPQQPPMLTLDNQHTQPINLTMDLRAAVKFLKLTLNNANDGNKNQQQQQQQQPEL